MPTFDRIYSFRIEMLKITLMSNIEKEVLLSGPPTNTKQGLVAPPPPPLLLRTMSCISLRQMMQMLDVEKKKKVHFLVHYSETKP